MNESDNHTISKRWRPGEATAKLGQLLDLLLADAMSDIEVVAREFSLQNEMRNRLRRSLDDLVCAQSVAGALFDEIAVDVFDDGARNAVNPMESVLGAMEILARTWPQNYGTDAVEWLVLGERRY